MKLSIIIPIFNAENYIYKCIHSILKYESKDVEIILVNDGSTDNSRDICVKLSSDHDNIILINKSNGGVSSARNMGITFAKYEYIMFVDVDDYVEMEVLLDIFSTMHIYDLAIFGFRQIDGNGKEKYYTCQTKVYSNESFLKNYWSFQADSYINSPCNKIYCKEIIKTKGIKFPEGMKLGEDAIFNIKYLEQCKSIFVSSQCAYNYVQHSSQSIRQTKQLYFDSSMKIYEDSKILLNLSGEYFPYIYSVTTEAIKNCLVLKIKFAIEDIKYYLKNEKVQMMSNKYKPESIKAKIYISLLKTNNVYIIYAFSKIAAIFKHDN